MKFDKSKVYTALNADEVRIGSKGYFASTIADLRITVEGDWTLRDVKVIRDDNWVSRFEDDNGDYYSFFYLVEEPKENRFRPYSNPDEMIEDFKKRYNSYGGWSGKDNPMYNPIIWVKHKETNSSALITFFSKITNAVTFADSDNPHSLGILFEQFVYLDGSPCGIMEE